MPSQLVIDFQEGFENDTVVIKVDGKQVFQKSNLKTSLLAGPTARFSLPTKEKSATVEVIVPTRNLTDKITLTSKDKTYLGISITKDPGEPEKIRFLSQQGPFGYL
jgi:hypothetical protein